jgi:hypothetical protein
MPNGQQKGDALSCLLFSLVVEKAIRDAGIQTTGPIFYKSVQLLTYADDIDIIARTPMALKEAFLPQKVLQGKWGSKSMNRRRNMLLLVAAKARERTEKIISEL